MFLNIEFTCVIILLAKGPKIQEIPLSQMPSVTSFPDNESHTVISYLSNTVFIFQGRECSLLRSRGQNVWSILPTPSILLSSYSWTLTFQAVHGPANSENFITTIKYVTTILRKETRIFLSVIDSEYCFMIMLLRICNMDVTSFCTFISLVKIVHFVSHLFKL